ncbi:MAG: hypothetical protein ACYS5V_01705, partial [Planctomycetota bacterium]
YSSIDYVIQRMITRELGMPIDRTVPPDKPRDGARLNEKVREAMGIGGLIESPMTPTQATSGQLEAPQGPAGSGSSAVSTPSSDDKDAAK